MANTKTAKANIKVNKRNHIRSQALRSKMRTVIKRASGAIQDKSENREKELRTALREIDKSVSKGILHHNTAARKKSQLARRFNQSLVEVAAKPAADKSKKTKAKPAPKAKAPAKKAVVATAAKTPTKSKTKK